MDREVVGVHEENVFEAGEEDGERFKLVFGHCKIETYRPCRRLRGIARGHHPTNIGSSGTLNLTR